MVRLHLAKIREIMGFFNYLYATIGPTLRGIFGRDTQREPTEPSRKRRGEEENYNPFEAKVRCVEGFNFHDGNNSRFNSQLDHRPSYSGGNHTTTPHVRGCQVQIGKWGQNGKENVGFSRSSYNSVKISTMHQQQKCSKEAGDEITVLEEHNHQTGTIPKRNHHLKTGNPFFGNSASSNADLDVEVLSPMGNPPQRKEVEVIKILQSPQAVKRDNDVQILKCRVSASKDGSGQRGAPFARKPFKAIYPTSSSTPVAFTSRRAMAYSPEQPDIEVLPSSSVSKVVSQSQFRRRMSPLSPQHSTVRDRNTLSAMNRSQDYQLYRELFMSSIGKDGRSSSCIMTPNGQRSGDQNASSSSMTSPSPHMYHVPVPVDSQNRKSFNPPPRGTKSCDRINIPVGRSQENEPSTSALRQVSGNDPDVQCLGQVCHPQHSKTASDDFLEDIIAKDAKKKELQKEAEWQAKLCRLLEERNRQAEVLKRKKTIMDMTDHLQQYLKLVEEATEEKKDEIPILPELTSEMQAEIDNALSAPPDMVLSTGFNLTVKGRDMRTLRPLAWLNDEVINFYMQLLIERGKSEKYPSVYAFNTFFFPKLINTGFDSLKRWTKKVDIFAHEYLLVPVHRGMHWCMAIIDMKEKIIRYYDSMDGRYLQCMDALLNYLQKESVDKKKQPFNTNGWVKEHAEDIPQQNNGSDCGMFACMFAEYVSRGAPITFTQEDMPYFRRKVTYEILKCKLLM